MADDYINPSMLGTSVALGRTGSDSSKWSKFNRFRLHMDEDFDSSGISYVFFTKPHCNLVKGDLKNDAFLNSLGKLPNGKTLIDSLDGLNGSGNKLIKILSNSAENFDTKDTTLTTNELSENRIGSKLSIPGSTTDSTTIDSFAIDYTEYSDLGILFLHKAWVDYIHCVRRGIIAPNANYIKEKVLDFVSSVYYFRMDESGKQIKFYSKYTGVYPINVPYSAMSFHLGEPRIKKLNITYNYSFKEDMNPEILDDFYALTSAYKTTALSAEATNNWASQVWLSTDKKTLYFG